MRVYIAGPYTNGDVVVNVRNAIIAGNILVTDGHLPFIPHLFHLWHMVTPQDYAYWTKMDMEWIEVCEVLIRLPGESSGSDAEVEKAKKLGIPVFVGEFSLYNFLEWSQHEQTGIENPTGSTRSDNTGFSHEED